jgi:hypothetical protein
MGVVISSVVRYVERIDAAGIARIERLARKLNSPTAKPHANSGPASLASGFDAGPRTSADHGFEARRSS